MQKKKRKLLFIKIEILNRQLCHSELEKYPYYLPYFTDGFKNGEIVEYDFSIQNSIFKSYILFLLSNNYYLTMPRIFTFFRPWQPVPHLIRFP